MIYYNLTGSTVKSPLVPAGSNATHYDMFGVGGYREVDTLNDLYYINSKLLLIGCLVFVHSENEIYKYEGSGNFKILYYDRWLKLEECVKNIKALLDEDAKLWKAVNANTKNINDLLLKVDTSTLNITELTKNIKALLDEDAKLWKAVNTNTKNINDLLLKVDTSTLNITELTNNLNSLDFKNYELSLNSSSDKNSVVLKYKKDNSITTADLPIATKNTPGEIKLGDSTSLDSANTKNYPVLLDGNNRAYVNVPWKDTVSKYKIAFKTPTPANIAHSIELSGSDSSISSADIPVASGTLLGEIKLGYLTDNTNKNYPVLLDGNNRAYVNVPWKDTVSKSNTYKIAFKTPTPANIAHSIELSGSDSSISSADIPVASGTLLGEIKLGYLTDNTNKNYAVLLDEHNRAYVNVPWVKGIDSGEIITQFTSFVFKRNPTCPPKPSGGTYKNPVPNGWSDGIPEGTDPIWFSTRIFNSDNSDAGDWSVPTLLTDSASMDVCYSNSNTRPDAPTIHGTQSDSIWHNDALPDDIWMAMSTRTSITDEWSNWEIFRIKGEDGKDGTSLKVVGTYDNSGCGLTVTSSKIVRGISDSNIKFADSSHTLTVGDCLQVIDSCNPSYNGHIIVLTDNDPKTWIDLGGISGKDGKSNYIHVKWSNNVIPNDEGINTNENASFTEQDGEVPGIYRGEYVDENPDDSTDINKYKWVRARGLDGFSYWFFYTATSINKKPESASIPTVNSVLDLLKSSLTASDGTIWYDEIPTDTSIYDPETLYLWLIWVRDDLTDLTFKGPILYAAPSSDGVAYNIVVNNEGLYWSSDGNCLTMDSTGKNLIITVYKNESVLDINSSTEYTLEASVLNSDKSTNTPITIVNNSIIEFNDINPNIHYPLVFIDLNKSGHLVYEYLYNIPVEGRTGPLGILGPPGEAADTGITIMLSNDVAHLPCNPDNSPIEDTSVTTDIEVFKGDTNVTSSCKLVDSANSQNTTSVENYTTNDVIYNTVSYSSTTNKYTLTSKLTDKNTNYQYLVPIYVKYNNYVYTKYFIIRKDYTGDVYELIVTPQVYTDKDTNKTLDIKVNRTYSRTGHTTGIITSTLDSEYSNLKIAINDGNKLSIIGYTTTKLDQASFDVKLYEKDNLIDEEVVSRVVGAQGPLGILGPPGEAADTGITILLSNDVAHIPCNSDNSPISDATVLTDIEVFKGDTNATNSVALGSDSNTQNSISTSQAGFYYDYSVVHNTVSYSNGKYTLTSKLISTDNNYLYLVPIYIKYNDYVYTKYFTIRKDYTGDVYELIVTPQVYTDKDTDKTLNIKVNRTYSRTGHPTGVITSTDDPEYNNLKIAINDGNKLSLIGYTTTKLDLASFNVKLYEKKPNTLDEYNLIDEEVVSRVVGSQGALGIQGCILRNRGYWSNTISDYVNDGEYAPKSATEIRYIDYVFLKGSSTDNTTPDKCYRVKYAHELSSQSGNTDGKVTVPAGDNYKPSANSEYWTEATYLEFAYIKDLIAELINAKTVTADEFLVKRKLTDNSTQIVAGMVKGDSNTTKTKDNVVFFAGTSATDTSNLNTKEAKTYITEGGKLHSEEAEIKGAVTASLLIVSSDTAPSETKPSIIFTTYKPTATINTYNDSGVIVKSEEMSSFNNIKDSSGNTLLEGSPIGIVYKHDVTAQLYLPIYFFDFAPLTVKTGTAISVFSTVEGAAANSASSKFNIYLGSDSIYYSDSNLTVQYSGNFYVKYEFSNLITAVHSNDSAIYLLPYPSYVIFKFTMTGGKSGTYNGLYVYCTKYVDSYGNVDSTGVYLTNMFESSTALDVSTFANSAYWYDNSSTTKAWTSIKKYKLATAKDSIEVGTTNIRFYTNVPDFNTEIDIPSTIKEFYGTSTTPTNLYNSNDATKLVLLFGVKKMLPSVDNVSPKLNIYVWYISLNTYK